MKQPRHNEPSPIEPGATCDRCGRVGTIARVTTHSVPPRVERFCRDCWKQLRHDLGPAAVRRLVESPIRELPSRTEHPPPTTVSSGSWDDTVDYLRLITTAWGRGSLPTEADFEDLAKEIIAVASEFDGPMPEEVRTFVTRHLGSDSGGDAPENRAV
jgi:hypothetical protein